MNPLLYGFPLETAEAAAAELQRILEPVCERTAPAAKLRRRQPFCREIELVVVPRVETMWRERRTARGAFAEIYEEPAIVDRLEDLCKAIRAGRHSRLSRPVRETTAHLAHWGERSKDFVFRFEGRWLPVRLWICRPLRFGAILALRTGDPEFANLLITPQESGGAMPLGLRQVCGQVERLETRRGVQAFWSLVSTPEEQDFFDLLGLPLLPPQERTEQRLRAILDAHHQREERIA